MKFTYAYKSRDGVRHEDVVSAASKDAAYSALRARGIRPIRVDLAPGALNWFLSLGKRTYVIVILVALVATAVVIIRSDSQALRMIEHSRTSPMPRHHIYGDPAYLDDIERTHFRKLMPTDADVVLAHYARPGTMLALDVDDRVAAKALEKLASDGFKPDLELTDADLAVREIAELKRIVLSMREEFRTYLSNGIGTPERYLFRLNERQRRELQIFTTAQQDIARTNDPAEWDRINNSLRSIGLPAIARPDEPK